MTARITIVALLVLYYFSYNQSRDVLLAAAVIVAIGDAADRISSRPKS